MTLPHLDAMDAGHEPGVSIWCAPLGATVPVYAWDEQATHCAASTMKLAVLAALFRAGNAGTLDIDAAVPVVNDFASAKPGAPRFSQSYEDDQDHEVWTRLGGEAPLRWIARRMIIASGNLATNIVLSHVGMAAVAETAALAGVSDGRIERGIFDLEARDAGIDNQVSARDLAMLLNFIATAPRHGEMLEMLFSQERQEDLAAGFPPAVRLAHKNGFDPGVRHGAGIVFPDDAPPYVITVCTTTRNSDEEACALIARIAAASWADRHEITR